MVGVGSFGELWGSGIQGVGMQGFRLYGSGLSLADFQVGSYRYRSLIEGLYALQKPYRSPIYAELTTCSFLDFFGFRVGF